MKHTIKISKAVLLALLGWSVIALSNKAFAQGGTWMTKPPMQTARCQTTAVELNGKVYAIGGATNVCNQDNSSRTSSVEVFDPVTESWSTVTPMPTARNELAAAVVDGKIYVIGGVSAGDKVEIYDPVTDTWSTAAPMPTKRIAMGATAVNGKIYVVGGCAEGSPDPCDGLATLEIYDPATDTWTTGAPMSTGRDGLGVAALDGKIYAVGGSDGNTPIASGEVYDPATNSWTPIASMPTARTQLRLAAVNGLLYAIGGEARIDGKVTVLSTVEIYDPTIDSWTSAPPMIEARGGHGVAVVNETLYALGGFDTSNAALSTIEAFSSIAPAADLAVTNTDSPDPVTVDNNLIYTIRVTNNGPDDATGVVVTNTLPVGVRLVSSFALQGSCSGGTTIMCNVGTLAKGRTATVIIVVRPTTAGTITSRASVRGNETDPNLANNTATKSTRVNPPVIPQQPCSRTWTGAAGDGLWQTAGNWTPVGVPGPTDNVCIGGAFVVTLSAGAHTINALEITSTGLFTISGGSLSIASASTIGSGGFTLSGGEFSGAGNLTVSGLFTWTSGTLSGTGATNANGGMNISGADFKSLGRNLNNAGTATWSGTGRIRAGNSTFNNQVGALFNAQNDQPFVHEFGGAPVFTNAGTFRKSVGTGTTTFSGVPFNNNNATIDVQSGTLVLASGGTSTSGTFTVATGAIFDLTGVSTHTYTGTYTGTGAGTIRLSGGTIAIGMAGATFNFSGSLFQWTGGTLTGSGILTNASTSTLNISGADFKTLDVTLNNAGTATWSGTGRIRAGDSVAFNNQASALFNAQNDQQFVHEFGGPPVFNNAGTFRKSVGTGTTTFNNVTLNNSSTVEVQSGTLSFISAGGTSTGTFTTATGTSFAFTGGTQTLNGATFTGTGLGRIAGGTVIVNGTVTAENFELASGTLDGAGTFASTVLSWTGGDMFGSGPTNVASTAVLNISGADFKSLGRNLNNAGTATWSGTGRIRAGNSVAFNNQVGALFNAQNDQQFVHEFGGAPVFTNAGTFRKSVGTGTTTFSGVPFNNSGPVGEAPPGTVEVQTGTLVLAGGGTSGGGTFTVASGAIFDLTGGSTHVYSGDYTGAGDGTIRLASGTLQIAMAGATFNFSGFEWTGGTLIGPGGLTNSGTLNISGADFKTLDVTLTNAGTVIWSGTGRIRAGDSVAFNNQVSALFDAQNDQQFVHEFGGAPVFTNAGILRKSAGTGTTTFSGVPLNNSGTVEVQSGTLNFTGGYTQTAGATILNGGNLQSSTTLNINGGSLSGAGTVTANVANGGQVNPGGSLAAGILNIMGTYTQSATGALNIEIGETDQFDQLTISGLATLNGTLNISLINGFQPVVDDIFEIITFGSSGGNFATINAPLPGARFFVTNLGPTSLTVLTQGLAGLAELAVTKTDAPDPVMIGQNLTYTITITNSGPDMATAVTVGDALPGNVTFVSALPSQGTCSGTSIVTCNLGSIAPSANATVTIVVMPTMAGVISNSVNVAGNEADPVRDNNRTTETTTVNPADLSVTKTGSPNPVTVGQNLTYTVIATNNGPSPATGATLTDTLPTGVTFVSVSSTQGSCAQAGGTVSCDLGNLAVSANATVTIVVTPTMAGMISNTVTVTANEPDPNPGNNTATQNTTVNPAPGGPTLTGLRP